MGRQHRRWACPYLIREGESAVNIQPVVSLQLQQRVSEQLLEEQREVRGEDPSGGGGLQVWDSHRFQDSRVNASTPLLITH